MALFELSSSTACLAPNNSCDLPIVSLKSPVPTPELPTTDI